SKIISGSNKNIDKVWQHLALAEDHVNTILDDGQANNKRIIAPRPALIKEAQRSLTQLTKLRKISTQYYKTQTQTGQKTVFEQDFIKELNTLATSTNMLEDFIYNKAQADLRASRKTDAALVAAAALLAFFISIILFKNRHRNIKQIAEISTAKQTLEESNQKLQAMAHYDLLTNLPNRTLFTDLLKTAITKAQTNQQSLVLFFIDLDQFKSVNDSFGHCGGDELLQLVAERLSHTLSNNDCVARLSGDEFALLLPPKSTQQQALDCASRVVKQVQASLAESFYIEETEIFISASIGVALYPKDGDSAESILKNADRSMHDVKQMGKNNYRFFSAELEQLTQRKFQLERDLRNAIQASELEL
ncbi:MAG: GGDEF domain-containing protein, partial [Methyloprofundus sp.]|nr:GGDEF domain-containing protein [Methyloprofundus sp.]